MDQIKNKLFKTVNAHALSKEVGINYARIADTIKFQNGMKLDEDESNIVSKHFKDLSKAIDEILNKGKSL